MKQILIIFLLFFSIGAYAQKYSVKNHVKYELVEVYDSANYNHMFKAGEFLSASGKAQLSAYGMAAICGTCSYLAVKYDNKFARGFAFLSGIGAFASQCFAISLKLKAGRELRIAAGEIVLKL